MRPIAQQVGTPGARLVRKRTPYPLDHDVPDTKKLEHSLAPPVLIAAAIPAGSLAAVASALGAVLRLLVLLPAAEALLAPSRPVAVEPMAQPLPRFVPLAGLLPQPAVLAKLVARLGLPLRPTAGLATAGAQEATAARPRRPARGPQA